VWLDDEELRFHLEMRVRDYLAQGYTREQAERAARERLGDLGQVQRELRSHERRRERMSRVWQDARIALRGFRRSPAFTASAVLILGIGMGMAVAMWTVFTAVLLRPLPLAAPDRVVLPRVHDKAGVDISLSVADVDRIRREAKTMSAVAGYAHGGAFAWPMVDGDRPFPIKGSQVQWQFFQVLGVQPVIGRLLDAGDDSLSHVMVLSYDAWQRIFSGDLKVVGRHFRQTMSGAQYTIVGVAPPGIDLPAATDYWSPMPFPRRRMWSPDSLRVRHRRWRATNFAGSSNRRSRTPGTPPGMCSEPPSLAALMRRHSMSRWSATYARCSSSSSSP
jgi:hypothetical protein